MDSENLENSAESFTSPRKKGFFSKTFQAIGKLKSKKEKKNAFAPELMESVDSIDFNLEDLGSSDGSDDEDVDVPPDSQDVASPKDDRDESVPAGQGKAQEDDVEGFDDDDESASLDQPLDNPVPRSPVVAHAPVEGGSGRPRETKEKLSPKESRKLSSATSRQPSSRRHLASSGRSVRSTALSNDREPLSPKSSSKRISKPEKSKVASSRSIEPSSPKTDAADQHRKSKDHPQRRSKKSSRSVKSKPRGSSVDPSTRRSRRHEAPSGSPRQSRQTVSESLNRSLSSDVKLPSYEPSAAEAKILAKASHPKSGQRRAMRREHSVADRPESAGRGNAIDTIVSPKVLPRRVLSRENSSSSTDSHPEDKMNMKIETESGKETQKGGTSLHEIRLKMEAESPGHANRSSKASTSTVGTEPRPLRRRPSMDAGPRREASRANMRKTSSRSSRRVIETDADGGPDSHRQPAPKNDRELRQLSRRRSQRVPVKMSDPRDSEASDATLSTTTTEELTISQEGDNEERHVTSPFATKRSRPSSRRSVGRATSPHGLQARTTSARRVGSQQGRHKPMAPSPQKSAPQSPQDSREKSRVAHADGRLEDTPGQVETETEINRGTAGSTKSRGEIRSKSLELDPGAGAATLKRLGDMELMSIAETTTSGQTQTSGEDTAGEQRGAPRLSATLQRVPRTRSGLDDGQFSMASGSNMSETSELMCASHISYSQIRKAEDVHAAQLSFSQHAGGNQLGVRFNKSSR